MADEWLGPELLLVAEHLLSFRKVGLVVEFFDFWPGVDIFPDGDSIETSLITRSLHDVVDQFLEETVLNTFV